MKTCKTLMKESTNIEATKTGKKRRRILVIVTPIGKALHMSQKTFMISQSIMMTVPKT